MFRIKAEFSDSFRKEFGNEPSRMFSDAFLSVFGSDAAVESCGNGACALLVRKSGLGDRMLLDRIREIFTTVYARIPTSDEVSVSVTEAEEDLWSLLLTPSGGSSRGRNLKVLSPEERIHALVGAEQFKVLSREIVTIAPAIIAHRTYSAFSFRSYLFSINEGCGFSTCLSLFSELIEKHGLFHFDETRRVVEEKLLSPSSEKVDPFSPVTDFLLNPGAKYVHRIRRSLKTVTDQNAAGAFAKLLHAHRREGNRSHVKNIL